MKHTKWIPALLIMALTLSMVSGCSAEQAGETDATEVPGMDVAVDEVLPEDDAPADEEAEENDNPGVQIPFALTLDTTEVSLDYSQRVTLTASASIGAGSIQWACSDENVASISRTTGDSVTVTAINGGTATVTCSLGGATQSCEVTVKSPQTLQITGVDYPATLVRGKSWKLQLGTVASPDNITEVSSVIRDANGTEMVPSYYSMPMDADVKRFEISGIDTHVPFSRIPEDGNYTWTLSATDESGRTVSLDLPINVVSDGETEVATEAGAYASAAAEGSVPEGSVAEEATAVPADTPVPETAAAAEAQPAQEFNGYTGVNLLRDTGSPERLLPGGAEVGTWLHGTWSICSGGDGHVTLIGISDSPVSGVTSGFRVSDQTEGNKDAEQQKLPCIAGQTYTISLYARVPSGSATLQVRIYEREAGNEHLATPIRQAIDNTDWQRFTGTFTLDKNPTSASALFGLSGAGNIEICGFKLECGNTATAWTPAPEDVYDGLFGRVINIPVAADGWITDAENGGLCHIDIPVASLSSADHYAYIAGLMQTGTEATDAPAREAFAALIRGVAGDGFITLYALHPPTTAFTLRLVAIATDSHVTEIIGLTNGF